MKKIITLFALSGTMLASAQTASQFIAAGTNDLVLNNLWGADTNFSAALALQPANKDANVLKAMTRLMVLPQTPAGSNFLVALGFPKTNRWLPHVPETNLKQDTNGYPIFPANYNSTNLTYFFRTNIMAAISNSIANLTNITDPGYTITLSSNETSFTLSPGQIFTETVTLDYGDIRMLRAMLTAMQCYGYTLNANNFSAVIPQVESWMETNGFTWQLALATYPNFLAMQNTGDLAASKSALTNAIANYFAASAFIRSRPADATNRLFSLDASEVAPEAEFRTTLTNVLLSLNAPVEFSPSNANAAASTAYLGAYFAGTHSLRSLMPKFSGDIYVNNSLPDYTFGGIVPDWPAYQIEATLRKQFHSYAGIYVGDGGLWDNNPSSYGGSFAVMVGTNQQALLIGTDNGDGYDDGSDFGVIIPFTVDKGGNWRWSSNNINAYGNISKDGSFWGEMDVLTNGFSAWFDGHLHSPAGSFQNQAGGYRGTTSSPDDPKLFGILTADGELFFCPLRSNGLPDIGDSAQFDSNNHFSVTQIGGTVIAGTLTNSTLKIGGTFNYSGGGGTWVMSRSNNVPFDLPPVISKDLPLSTNAVRGTNVTFVLTATGSPPLCYQWYFNGGLIPFATTNTLVVSNLQSGSAGIYSVAVNNAVGGTNTAATLNVIMPTRPVLNSAGLLSSGKFRFQINGDAGQNYTLQMSTNLAATNWISVLATNAPAGSFFITDTNATNLNRFYRIKVGQ
jgi:hypothetical protein